MRKFINDIKKYFRYSVYAAKAELKAEVAGSYLNWLWWILDPLCFMLIYIFIATIVFGKGEPNFPIFVIIGLTCWDYFNRNISSAVKIVKANKGIVTKIYIPKYILLLQKSFEFFFKMMISCCLIIVFMFFYGIPFTLNLLYLIPIFIVFYLFTFGFGCILLHFGIFVEDLVNITALVLKMVFYLSGIFYKVGTRVPVPFNDILLKFNPAAFIIDAFRDVILDARAPAFDVLALWFFIGLFLTMIGIRIIQKYENSYAKVI